MIGQTVSHYKILEKLGEGGMGVVYKAEDTHLKRTVALKFLNAAISSTAENRIRFLREARAASMLDHPNICTIFEVGETPEQEMFLAMAYYDGTTLQGRVSGGPMPIDEAVSIGVQVALGLQAAHERGVIHRDIKSSNVMLTTDGRVKIMDFGLAKFSGRSQITGAGAQLGTLSFMAPEQVQGSPADARSDVWALGVTLYNMVTGRLPFASEYDQALTYAILHENPTPPSALRRDLPAKLEEVILRCLQHSPSDRYQSAGEVADRLFQFSPAPPRSSVRRAPKSLRRRGILAGAVALTAILLYFIVRTLLGHGPVQENAVIVEVRGTATERTESQDMTAEMVEFLVTDEVLQSTNKDVFRPAEFHRLHPDKSPSVSLTVALQQQDVGYRIDVTISRAREVTTSEMSFQVHDRSALLTQVLPEIRRRVIFPGSLGECKPSTFTANWDAFVRFYLGFRALERLELPRAREHLDAALTIDPQFALAKLRLAETLAGQNSNVSARSLLQTVQPALHLLSKVDSLRAEALRARLASDFRREVAIRREIYQLYPLRTESSFGVAEAYYWLCEIPPAISYYKIALALDPHFARAYNHLGYCYSHLGAHDSALTTIRKYLELDSTANAFDSMGDCYLAAGYLDSAAWAKQRGIAIDPELSYLYPSLTHIRLLQGRIEEADNVANRYFQYLFTPDLMARGYTLKAFVAYERRDYRTAQRYCQKALETFDAPDLGMRYPDLHWLLAQVSLALNDFATVYKELQQMETLLRDNNINPTNYQVYYYKYYRHLQACLAARRNEITGVLDVAKELDGPLRARVKDHSSRFDYAYLSTALGELLAAPPLNRTDFAIERCKLALQYNPRYPRAHYTLWRCYLARGEKTKAEGELRIVKALWKDADPGFKKLYGIPK
jgi:serine/threonine protein kinase/tetratricopeptide (TPR) repeat protein